jgi:type IV secretion system protein VirB4
MLKNSNNTPPQNPWQEVLPWLAMITPELMLCKDGSLLAGFEYQAIDVDNLDDDRINECTSQLQRAFSSLDNRFSAWFIVTKLRDYTYPEGEFSRPAAKALDDLVKRQFTSGQVFSIKHRLYIGFTGNTGVSKFMDTVQALNKDGNSIFRSFLKAMNPAYATKNAALHDVAQLENNINEFETAIKPFLGVLASISTKRLVGWELESSLIQEANIATPVGKQFKCPPGTLLDGWASQSEVSIGKDMIKVQGATGSKFCAQLYSKSYPPSMHSLKLETLLASDCEIKICHAIRFQDYEAAHREIDIALNYFEMTQYSLVARVLKKLSGAEMTPRPGKADLYLQCVEAKRRQMAEGLGFCLHSMSVSVYGDSVKECEDNFENTEKLLSRCDFTVIRERLNLAASFASMLPGQWATQLRLNLENVAMVADCLPLYTVDPGNAQHPYFSEEIYKRDVPAFSVFQNVYGSKSYFDPHVKQVGHALIIASTGGGKTTFVNFALSQFNRYKNSRVIVFDRDWSCRITTELHNGTHIDLKSNQMKVNPLFALRDGSNDGLVWCREWILRRLREGGFSDTATDREALDDALMTLKKTSQELSLSVLATQLPLKLRTELGEWLQGRPYGMFDSFEDDFEIASWTCIEMKEIMANERLARAFLDYAFRRITSFLDGIPTFIYLEEASFLLNNAAFAPVIDDWLKTFRKKNAFLWMSVQSPDSVTNSEISATLRDNVKSIFLLRNIKVEAHRDSYVKNFGLTHETIDMLAGLMPVGEYMLIKDGFCRKLRTLFDNDSLAYLRSELPYQNIFDRYKNSGDPDWRNNYLNEVSRKKL